MKICIRNNVIKLQPINELGIDLDGSLELKQGEEEKGVQLVVSDTKLLVSSWQHEPLLSPRSADPALVFGFGFKMISENMWNSTSTHFKS